MVDLSGAAVTALTGADFTFTLERYVSGSGMVAVSDAVSVAEIDSVNSPGDYLITWTPTEGTGLHRLSVATVDTSNIPSEDTYLDDVSGIYTASGGPWLSTLGNVKSSLDITVTAEDDRIDALLAAVTTWGESFCGRKFFSAARTEYYAAGGVGNVLLVLDVWPVTSVTSVHESLDLPRVWDATTLLTANEAYLYNPDNGFLHRVDGSDWATDPRSIQVIYTAGYATAPADIERAAIELIAAKLQKGKQEQYHITSTNVGDGAIGGIRFDDMSPHTRATFELYRV